MKIFKTGLVFVVVLVTVYTNGNAEVESRPKDCEKHNIQIATGQPDGIYYYIGQILTRDDNSMGFFSTQGSIANLDGVKKCKYDFGIVQSDVLRYYRSANNQDPNSIESETTSQALAVGAIYREPVYILVRNRLKLTRIAELRGKKVSIGLEGSGTKFTAETILGMFGITLDEFEPEDYGSEKIIESFKNESIDAAFIVIAEMPEEIQELIGEDEHVYILKINRSDLIKIASAQPKLYRLIDVPNPVEKTEFRTISVTSVLVTNNETDPNAVDKLTERLCRLSKEKENYPIDPKIAKLLVDYPNVLYGETFHETTLNCYEKAGLAKNYATYRKRPFWISSVLFVLFLIFIALIFTKQQKYLGFHKWHIWIRYRIRIWFFICIFLAIVFFLYILLYHYESVADNPDISGSLPKDWLNMLLHVSKVSEMYFVTAKGKFVGQVASVIGPIFGIGLAARAWGPWVWSKIQEVLKMAPKNSYGHVVICNWTEKTKMIIKELRSPIARKERIFVIARPTQDPPEPNMLDKNVWLIEGDPTDEETLDKRASISGARTILILADEKHTKEPDAVSLLILQAVKNVLKRNNKEFQSQGDKEQHKNNNTADDIHETQPEVGRTKNEIRKGSYNGERAKKKPKIIVEVTNPDFEGYVNREGARGVPSIEVMAKLLARAVGLSEVVEFIRKILTSEKHSNEIYDLDISKTCPKILETYKKDGRECTFQDFAQEIAKEYAREHNRRGTEEQLTVIGLKSKGKLYINPKQQEFSQIRDTIDSAFVIAWEPPEKLKLRIS